MVRLYYGALRGQVEAEDLWQAMDGVADSNGNAQGVTLGSFEVIKDRTKASMKKTAYQQHQG